ALDPRSAARLVRLLVGAILARGRRTVTSWIRAAGLSHEYRPCYTTVAAAGRRADGVAARLVHGVLKPILGGMDRLVFGIDDSRLRRDAALRTVPARRPGRRGRPRAYGDGNHSSSGSSPASSTVRKVRTRPVRPSG